MNIEEQLKYTEDSFNNIQKSIINKGVFVSDDTPRMDYSLKIDEITQEGSIEPIITISPSETHQEVRPSEGFNSISGVNVEAIVTKQVSVISTKDVQIIVPEEGSYINEITVQPVDEHSGNTTGNIDREGLSLLGYSEEEIDLFQTLVFWDKELDHIFEVPEWNKSLVGLSIDEINSVADKLTYLPKSVFTSTDIPTNAFKDCKALVLVVIPQGVTVLGSNSFSGCTSLNKIVLPNTLNTVGSNVFYNCSSLTSLELPDNIITIPGTFAYMASALSYVKMPLYLQEITAYSAFRNCKSLRKIKFSKDINYLGFDVFRECNSLYEIDLSEVLQVPVLGNTSTFTNCNSNLKILVPMNLLEAFKIDVNWVVFTNNIHGV